MPAEAGDPARAPFLPSAANFLPFPLVPGRITDTDGEDGVSIYLVPEAYCQNEICHRESGCSAGGVTIARPTIVFAASAPVTDNLLLDKSALIHM